MRKLIYFCFTIFSWSNYCFSQSIRIQNSATNEPIAYVNISLENQEGSFTSDENGFFQLPKNKKSKVLIFDAVGYEKLEISIDKITNQILLNQKMINLKEVVIKKSKKITKEIGKTKGESIFYCMLDLTDEELKPSIIAKYFETKSDNESSLLKTIKIKTSAPDLKPLINFRIYSKGKDGQPNETLYNENILCTVKEGDNTTKIDVSNLGIEVPNKGFFVAIEALVIDRNKQERKYVYKGIEHIHKFYYPLIKMNQIDTFTDTWYKTGNNWNKNDKLSLIMELELEE